MSGSGSRTIAGCAADIDPSVYPSVVSLLKKLRQVPRRQGLCLHGQGADLRRDRHALQALAAWFNAAAAEGRAGRDHDANGAAVSGRGRRRAAGGLIAVNVNPLYTAASSRTSSRRGRRAVIGSRTRLDIAGGDRRTLVKHIVVGSLWRPAGSQGLTSTSFVRTCAR